MSEQITDGKLVLIHYVGPTRHECFVYAGTILIGEENHLSHGDLAEAILDVKNHRLNWPVCLATLAADLAIGLNLTLDERRVDEAEYRRYEQQWSLLDFSATTEWQNRGGFGTPPAAGPD